MGIYRVPPPPPPAVRVFEKFRSLFSFPFFFSFSIIIFFFLFFFFFFFLFFVFCLSLSRSPLAPGPLDIVHPCHPVATPLDLGQNPTKLSVMSLVCKVGLFYSSVSISQPFNTKKSFLQLFSRKATLKCEVLFKSVYFTNFFTWNCSKKC